MADAPLKRKLVVLEDGALTAMALNPELRAEFPALAPLARIAKTTQRAGCGSCGRAGQEKALVFQQVKQALASMDAAKKRKLKEHLNAQSVRILYRNAMGKPQELTF